MTVKKVTASSNAVLSGTYRIVGLRLVATSDAATAIVYDSATQAGNEVAKLAAVANSADREQWEQISAPMTTTGISVTLSGTNPILYIYYV